MSQRKGAISRLTAFPPSFLFQKNLFLLTSQSIFHLHLFKSLSKTTSMLLPCAECKADVVARKNFRNRSGLLGLRLGSRLHLPGLVFKSAWLRGTAKVSREKSSLAITLRRWLCPGARELRVLQKLQFIPSLCYHDSTIPYYNSRGYFL